ncbi:MAG: RseA family anti-sigma factor [Gammaproteobacteria bacterium]
METHKKLRVHLSALADGELAPADVELALALLGTPDGEQRWDLYHRIGDELRAQATPALSDDFSARLKARLDAEPLPGAGRRAAKALDGAAPARRPGSRGNSQHKRAARAAAAPEPADELPADAKAVVLPKPAIASVS